MRIQEDTKATVYLSNLLGDLGVMSSRMNGGSDEDEPPAGDDSWKPPDPGTSNSIITRDALFEKLIDYLQTNFEQVKDWIRDNKLYETTYQGVLGVGSQELEEVKDLVTTNSTLAATSVGKDGSSVFRSMSARLLGCEGLWRALRLVIMHYAYDKPDECTYEINKGQKVCYAEGVQLIHGINSDYHLHELFKGDDHDHQAGLWEAVVLSKLLEIMVIVFTKRQEDGLNVHVLTRKDGEYIDDPLGDGVLSPAPLQGLHLQCHGQHIGRRCRTRHIVAAQQRPLDPGRSDPARATQVGVRVRVRVWVWVWVWVRVRVWVWVWVWVRVRVG